MKLSEIIIRPLLDTIQLIDMSDAEYFGPKYRGYISNSRLALINPEQGGSPETFFEGLGAHQKYSSSLVFGSAVHELVLQPDSFMLVESVNRPTAKAGFVADELYPMYLRNNILSVDDINAAAAKIDYYGGNLTDKQLDALRIKCSEYFAQRKAYETGENFVKGVEPIYLDEKSRETLKQCLESVKNCKEIQDLLHPSYIIDEPISLNEQAVLMDLGLQFPGGETLILKIKAKLDNFTIEPDSNTVTLNDLKTTGHYLTQFDESWEKYHYYRQMGMYGWLLMLVAENLYKMENSVMKTNMLLISTVPQYKAGVYPVSRQQILRGFDEFKRLIRMVGLYTMMNNADVA